MLNVVASVVAMVSIVTLTIAIIVLDIGPDGGQEKNLAAGPGVGLGRGEKNPMSDVTAKRR